jgi:NADPH:quinone reductase-like Zn-dependent oxidoreductase
MNTSIPQTMKAAAIDRFGGPAVLKLRSLPVPRPKAQQVLIRLDTAGIGVWDPEVRAGEVELGPKRKFPRVIGNDGAGTVAAVGGAVKRFKVGDRVYAFAYQGGFYAEYVAVPANDVARVPPGLDPREAGALGADGITALRGLDDTLRLKAGEMLLIFGASGGIGHIAVQLAKRMGAKVFAVASKRDGVALARRVGADAAVDGHKGDVARAARAFAPSGFDAALVLVGGRGLDAALAAVKKGGRIAYPNGVQPAPRKRKGVRVRGYDGTPARDAFERLNRLIGRRPFHVELGRVYRLEDAAAAHRQIEEHHLGKLAFEIRTPGRR